MSNSVKNTLVLALLWAVVASAGGYITWWYYPGIIQKVEKEEKQLQQQQSKISQLSQERERTAQMVTEIKKAWQHRYKEISDTLYTHSIIRFINENTQKGFETLDINYQGYKKADEHGIHTFRVTGTGYFVHLYELIWELEQKPYLYRVRDLTLRQVYVNKTQKSGGNKRYIMLNFSMDVEGYFAEQPDQTIQETTYTVNLPDAAFPNRSPQINPFYPVIKEEVPPNSNQLVDIENTQLVAIANKQAVFLEGNKRWKVSQGDAVYLGRLTKVDPENGKVVALLNKGGIVEEVVLTLDQETARNPAKGKFQLTPADSHQSNN